MSEDANSALVRRFIDEVFNAGDFDGVAEILAADYVHHDPTTQEFGSGIEGFKRLIGYYRDAFPDLTITLDDQFGAGDRVVDRWTGQGTHRGELMGIPATREADQRDRHEHPPDRRRAHRGDVEHLRRRRNAASAGS